jgi:hypothetical protein
MSLILECEIPPLYEDAKGAIRVGNSRVLLELVIRAFQDGASAESIVQRDSTLLLNNCSEQSEWKGVVLYLPL